MKVSTLSRISLGFVASIALVCAPGVAFAQHGGHGGGSHGGGGGGFHGGGGGGFHGGGAAFTVEVAEVSAAAAVARSTAVARLEARAEGRSADHAVVHSAGRGADRSAERVASEGPAEAVSEDVRQGLLVERQGEDRLRTRADLEARQGDQTAHERSRMVTGIRSAAGDRAGQLEVIVGAAGDFRVPQAVRGAARARHELTGPGIPSATAGARAVTRWVRHDSAAGPLEGARQTRSRAALPAHSEARADLIRRGGPLEQAEPADAASAPAREDSTKAARISRDVEARVLRSARDSMAEELSATRRFRMREWAVSSAAASDGITAGTVEMDGTGEGGTAAMAGTADAGTAALVVDLVGDLDLVGD